MKTEIYYFSGTGNSLVIARDLKRESVDAEVISIPEVIKKDSITSGADRIGIVFPVYMWGAPLMVVDFIKKLKVNKDKYIFAVATYGGMAGGTISQVARELKKQGLVLAAGFNVMMPGNYTPLYGAIAKEKQDEMFGNAALKVKKIASVVKNAEKGIIEKGSAFLSILSGIIYTTFSPKMPVMDKDFWVNEKCTSCGLCEKVCVAENIKMIEGKPRWTHKCEQCLACLQWCPEEAIQYGKSTVGRKRYRHPGVKADDFVKK